MRLYTVDLTAVNINHPEVYGEPLLLEWMWRPIPLGSPPAGAVLQEHLLQKERAAVHNAAGGGGGGAKGGAAAAPATTAAAAAVKLPLGAGNNEASFLARGSRFPLKWEVRLTYNHQELRTLSADIATNTCTTRRLIAASSDWAASSCVLSDLPLKGIIEVWVRYDGAAEEKVEEGTADRIARKKPSKVIHSAFQGMRLKLSRIQPSGGGGRSFLIAGDSHRYGGAYKFSAANPYLCGEQLRESLLDQFEVLRAIRCPAKADATDRHLLLSWQAKLAAFPDRSDADSLLTMATIATAAKTVSGSDAVKGVAELVPPNHTTLGYQWRLCLFRNSGGFSVLREGRCVGVGAVKSEQHPADDDSHSGSSSSITTPEPSHRTDKPLTDGDGVLKAWVWRDSEAVIDEAHEGDLLVLAAKVISTQANYPQQYLQQCSTIVTHFQLTNKIAERELNDGAAATTAAKLTPPTLAQTLRCGMGASYEVVHDDPNCDSLLLV